MVDAQQSDARLQRECLIYRGISHKELKELLGALSRSLSIESPLKSVEEQQPQNKIDPNFLASSFAPTKELFFYLDPFLRERVSTTPVNILAKKDVVTLLQSINLIIDEQKLGNTDDLATFPEGLDLKDRIKKGLDVENRTKLRDDVVFMFQVVDVLEKGPTTGAAKVEVEIAIPERLKALIDRPLDLKESWPIVKQLAQDADKLPNDSRTLSTTIEGTATILKVIQFRFFINDWLKKLYSDDFRIILDNKRIVLPEMEQFAATNKFFAFIDRDDWNDLDHPIPTFILKELSPVIDDFFKAKDYVPPSYAATSTESSEGEASVTEKKSDDELESLLQKFSGAHASYRLESERLTKILLPQFFTMHSINRSTEELELIDPAAYNLVAQEFRSELHNVLRTLSPEEFKLLGERGGSLEFRLIVLRRLYGKLSTNPRFMGSLLQYKEKYVEYLQKKVETGEASPKELADLDARINLTDGEFEKKLEEENKKEQAKTGVSWAAGAGSTLAEFSELHSSTQADVQRFVTLIANGEKVDYETLFRNIDVLIAERWSPEQIRALRGNEEAFAILGIDLPDAIKNDPARVHIFFQLCAEFMYARRQRLADHYELDAIARESSKPGTLDSLKTAQEIAEKYKDEGGGESLLVARASDSSRVQEYAAAGHNRAGTIAAIHKDARDEREKSVQARQQSLGEQYRTATTIEGKRALLASLGVLSKDVDDVNAPVDRQMALLQSLFDNAMQQDLADGNASLDGMSYFEDQDKDVVTDRSGGMAVPMRYGKPGAKSLMKGGLDLKNKYQGAKNRVNGAKKALKNAKKGLDTTAKAVVQVIKSKNRLQQGALAVGLASLIQTMSWVNQGWGATIGAAFGAAGGAFLGSYLSPFGTVMGGLGGSFGGAYLGHELDKRFSFLQKDANAFRVEAPSLGSSSPLSTPTNAAKAATATPAGVSLTGSGGNGATAVTVVGGTIAGTIMIATTTLTASLQSPPIQTLNASGLESEYVSILKKTTGETSYPGSVPSQITYQIVVQAKNDYQIDIVNFQDKFTIKLNTEKNTGSPAELNCDSQLNMDTAKVKTIKAEDGEVLLGECTVPLSQDYHDSSVSNQFTLQFKVTQNGQEIKNDKPDPSCGENENTFCALTALSICLGECPTAKQGCWPVSGTTTQPPYGEASHSVVDALDIGAPLGRTIFAPFDGTAYAFDAFSPEPSQQGLVFRSGTGALSRIYGKHVLIVTNDGFVLLFGHMSQHGPLLQLGQGVTIKAGDVIGAVGNSGSSGTYLYPDGHTTDRKMGYHLHYEYRVPAGGSWHSVIPGIPKDPLSSIVPGVNGGKFVYANGLQTVSYDGGASGNLPQCTTR